MNERFSLGKVLGTGFRVWGTNIVPFLIITTLLFSPLLIWTFTLVSGTPSLKSAETFQNFAGILGFVLGALVQAALTYGVVMELQGKRAGIGGCISTGLVRFFPVLGVAILSTLIWFAGLIALIVPGVILYCMVFVSVPASVIERPGIVGAIKRSQALTENHRLEIFGLALIIVGGQQLILRLIESSMKIESLKDLQHFMFVMMGFILVWSSLTCVMNAVAYFYLRQEKEGTSAAELAKVFE